jgi:hypothetical protein
VRQRVTRDDDGILGFITKTDISRTLRLPEVPPASICTTARRQQRCTGGKTCTGSAVRSETRSYCLQGKPLVFSRPRSARGSNNTVARAARQHAGTAGPERAVPAGGSTRNGRRHHRGAARSAGSSVAEPQAAAAAGGKRQRTQRADGAGARRRTGGARTPHDYRAVGHWEPGGDQRLNINLPTNPDRRPRSRRLQHLQDGREPGPLQIIENVAI